MENIQKLIEKVDGWLTLGEGTLLYNLAKKAEGKGVIVEIGSYTGKSTVCLGKGSLAGNKVKIYAVDPHLCDTAVDKYGKDGSLGEFQKNIREADVLSVVELIHKTSEDAAKQFTHPVEVAFIDGSHDYDMVKLDFDVWFPQVIDGGWMAFHDTTIWKGPKKVVKDHVFKGRHFRNVKLVDTITYAQKVAENTFGDRVRNRLVMWMKSFYDAVYRLHGIMPKGLKQAGKKMFYRLQGGK